MNKLFAEAIGTFALVFAGTGAIVINTATTGGVSHVGIALTFGLIVMAMIYAVGDISGAHLNPAVTLGFVAAGRFEARRAASYIAAQIAGAFAASALLLAMFPKSPTLGETLPSGSVVQSFIFEIVLTFLLMLVILRVSTGPKEKGITAAIAVGGVVALEALFAGPICGASMNPARSLAPAILSRHTTALWAYLVAPTLGALLAVAAERALLADPKTTA
jgi:aquaporin Z